MVDSKRKKQSGDSEHGTKRQRVSRACDQCRSAREKCDGIQPICFTCASSNRSCTYTANPKRRGIQPGYIRTLELTLAWTLCNVPGSEERLLGLLQEESGQALISSTDSPTSNKLHKKWRNHLVSRAIDRVLSGESTSDLFESEVVPSGDDEDDDDEGSGHEPRSGPDAPFMTPESLKTGQSQFPADNTSIPPRPEPLLQDSSTVWQVSPAKGQLLQLPTNHWRLIDVYFAYTHSWLPVTSKEQVLKLCYSYPKEGLQLLPGAHSADHAELWSILALASIQNHATSSPVGMASFEVLKTAEGLCFPVVDDVGVGHVGALLTLSIINIALQKLQLAWLMLGRAIRIGTWLQFDPKRSGMSAGSKIERLHGLLLGCFVVETILAVRLEIAPSLRSGLVKDLDSIPEEGLDEWQPWTGCDGFQTSKQPIRATLPAQVRSTFNQLLKLCCILNDRLVDANHNQRPAASSTTLSNWLATLPTTLGPLHSMSLEQTSPQKLHLFLAFLVGRSYDSHNRATIEEALSVLDHFSYALGVAAMPPLFACFLSIFKDRAEDDGFQQNRLAGILNRFASVWRQPGRDNNQPVSPTTVDLSTPAQDTDTTPRPLPDMAAHVASTASQHASSPDLQRTASLQLPNADASLHQPQSVHTVGTIEDSLKAPPLFSTDDPLRTYSVDQTMDLDALFDHFTSIEGADQLGLHPQFMQNLGFAPNANLADLMTNEYGWAFHPG